MTLKINYTTTRSRDTEDQLLLLNGVLVKRMEHLTYDITIPFLDLKVPFWSISVQVAMGTLVFLCRRLVSQRETTSFTLVNEFLCSFLWVVWTLEAAVISFASSDTLALINLFVRLVLIFYTFQGACANPSVALYKQLLTGFSPRRMLLYVAIELAAMVLALLYVSTVWSLLGQTVSKDHREFLLEDCTYILQVSPLNGFLIELVITFAMFLPLMFMSQSFIAVIGSCLFTLLLVILFQAPTGAFMNPLTALAFTLNWHTQRLNMTECFIHILVYWCGPYTGSFLAVLAARRIQAFRNQQHEHTE